MIIFHVRSKLINVRYHKLRESGVSLLGDDEYNLQRTVIVLVWCGFVSVFGTRLIFILVREY